MKITVIGSGNMGGALIKGFMRQNVSGIGGSGKFELTITAKTQNTLDQFKERYPSIKTSLDNRVAVSEADVIILAVKPWLIEKVANEISEVVDLHKQTLISVAANVSTQKLLEYFGQEKGNVFYAMPNIAAEFGESMTFVAAAEGVSTEKTAEVETLLSEVGSVKVVEERLVASGMMMAGCGIAYVMRYIRAMMEGGVEMGFYPKDAQKIAMQTMKGAITLLEETGLHPEAAIDKVTTPGGTTIKGLNELDHSGFNSAVINSLKAGLK